MLGSLIIAHVIRPKGFARKVDHAYYVEHPKTLEIRGFANRDSKGSDGILDIGGGMYLDIPKRLIRDGYIRLDETTGRPGSISRDYVLCIPLDMLEDPSTQFLLRAEYDGPGYETEERRLLDTLLPPECLFLDIGAHWGIYTLHVLSSLPNARVVAVEPDAENLRHLQHNLFENDHGGRAEIVDAAIAETDGHGWLRRNTSMGHHLSATPGDGAAREVPTTTIDSLVERFDPDCRRDVWIKLDIEGRELAALRGATRSLGNGRIGGVLWEARVGGIPNPDASTITSLLRDQGMKTRSINDDYRLSVPRTS